QHFEVDTKFLAAVVKGTHFIVTADALGASVTVDRGAVAVESLASRRSTTVTLGQTASVARSTDLAVSGGGTLPAIFSPDGSVYQPPGGVPAQSGQATTGGPAGGSVPAPAGAVQPPTPRRRPRCWSTRPTARPPCACAARSAAPASPMRCPRPSAWRRSKSSRSTSSPT